MKRLILISPALTSVGGHYYEYARRVGNAAQRSGYRALVATHRAFPGDLDGLCHTLPIYRDGLWRHQYGSLVLRLCDLFNAAFRKISKRLRLTRISDAEAVRSLPGSSRWPETVAAMQRLQDRLAATRFAEDTERLLKDIEPQRDDVFFLPDMAGASARGLSYVFRRGGRRIQGRWHLLFHSTLTGDPSRNRGSRTAGRQLLQEALRQLRACDDGRRVALYTDSRELTSEYNGLGVSSFQTLPVPAAPASPDMPPSESPPGRPLRVVFLGDARSSKGFTYLPAVVEALQRELAAARIRFILQAYYARSWPDLRSLAARRRLRQWPADQVEQIETPLSSEAYHALLHSAHIVILPYDDPLYRAQSSSVFAEALAAGKPVVVPEGTWMARQLSEAETRSAGRRTTEGDRDTRPPAGQPAGAVGIVCRKTPEAFAEAVREMVGFYEHYRDSAAEFSQTWRRLHCAEHLVERLMQPTGDCRPEANAQQIGMAPFSQQTAPAHRAGEAGLSPGNRRSEPAGPIKSAETSARLNANNISRQES